MSETAAPKLVNGQKGEEEGEGKREPRQELYKKVRMIMWMTKVDLLHSWKRDVIIYLVNLFF